MLANHSNTHSASRERQRAQTRRLESRTMKLDFSQVVAAKERADAIYKSASVDFKSTARFSKTQIADAASVLTAADVKLVQQQRKALESYALDMQRQSCKQHEKLWKLILRVGKSPSQTVKPLHHRKSCVGLLAIVPAPATRKRQRKSASKRQRKS